MKEIVVKRGHIAIAGLAVLGLLAYAVGARDAALVLWGAAFIIGVVRLTEAP